MAVWKFAVRNPGDTADTWLPARSPVLNFRAANGALHEGQFTLSRKDSATSLLVPYVTEVFAWRDSWLALRGPLQFPVTDTGDGTSETVTYAFADQRAWLDRLEFIDADCDQVWVVEMHDASGGMWALGYGPDETPGIKFGEDPEVVRAALEALPSIGAGRCSVTGSSDSYTVTIFQDVPLHELTVINALTGNVITFEGPVSGGVWAVTFGPYSTDAIDFDIGSTSLQEALNAVPTTSGLADVSGSELGPFRIKFGEGVSPWQMGVVTNSLVGGTATVTNPTITVTPGPAVGTVTYGGIDTGDIPRRVLGKLQAHTGANRQIAPASTPGPATGAVITQSFSASQSGKAAIDQIAQQTIGFEWDVLPFPAGGESSGALTTWPNGRGVVKAPGQQLTYPGDFTTYDRQSQMYATAIRVTGGTDTAGNPLPAVVLELADLATRPEGRLDYSTSAPDLRTTPQLQAFAARLLNDVSQNPESLTVTLTKWGGPSVLWLGDTTRIGVSAGKSLDIDTPMRAVEFEIHPRDDGGELVSVVFGRPTSSFNNPFAPMLRRLADLERLT